MASLEPKATATSGERDGSRGGPGARRGAGASLLAAREAREAREARKARAFADVDREVTGLSRGGKVIASVTLDPINLRLERERGRE